MTTKLDELKSLVDQQSAREYRGIYIDQSELSALIAAVEAAQAVAADAERSLYGDETDDPACCDPYLVGRQKIKALRAALAALGE